MSSIFISYRREDAEGQAGRLYDDLVKEFGSDSVFMDVAAIQFGRDFRTAIDQSLASCGAFLSVIGKGWLTATDASGQRRLDHPSDFVRIETAAALRRDIPVIPVLVQGAILPKEEQLPEDLRNLAYRNAIELSHPRWDSDVQVLVNALRPYASKTTPKPAEPNPPGPPVIPEQVNRGRNQGNRAGQMALIAIVLAAMVGVAAYLWPARKVEVPDLKGQMLDSARQELDAEHLALGTAREKADPRVAPGTIVAQSVRAGEQVPPGTRIDVTLAAERKAENSEGEAASKRVPSKKIALPEPSAAAMNPAPAPQKQSGSYSADPVADIQAALQLSAGRRSLDQKPPRYDFTLSVKIPETDLSSVSRVHYDLVYTPNPLSLEGGAAPDFSASYEGWGCYSTVIVSVYLNSGQQPIKKTFDMCKVLQ